MPAQSPGHILVRRQTTVVLLSLFGLVPVTSLPAQQGIAWTYVEAARIYCEAARKAAGPERQQYLQGYRGEAAKAQQLGTSAPPCNVPPEPRGSPNAASGSAGATGIPATAPPLIQALTNPVVIKGAFALGSAIAGLFKSKHRDPEATGPSPAQIQAQSAAAAAAEAEARGAAAEADARRLAEEAERRAAEIRQREETARLAAEDERLRTDQPRAWFAKHYENLAEAQLVVRESSISAKLGANSARYSMAGDWFATAYRTLTVMQNLFPRSEEIAELTEFFNDLVQEARKLCGIDRRIALNRELAPPDCSFGMPF